MSRNVAILAAVAALALTLSQAQAQLNVYTDATAGPGIKSIDILSVDTGATLPGYVTQDIVISFEGQLLSHQILLTLDQGTIYQDAFGAGTHTPPNGLLFGAFPAVQYDTFVGIGGRTEAEQAGIGGILMVGPALNLGSEAATATFSTSLLDQAWAPQAGVSILSGTDFFLARISLSDNAIGTWSFTTRAGNDADRVFVLDQAILDGNLIPEPVSLALLGVGSLVLFGRRRVA